MLLLGTCKEAADAFGVQGSSEQTWLSAPRSWSRGLTQAPASKIFSNDEECQGSDAEGRSSSDEDNRAMGGRYVVDSSNFPVSVNLLTLSDVTERGNE